MKSTQAKAAKAIRTLLTEHYPKVKFKVTSTSFAGGNAVRVSYVDGPTLDAVNKLVKPYQYGSFNCMIDMYECDNHRSDIPQTKYVSVDRHISPEVLSMLTTDQANCTDWLKIGSYEQCRRINAQFETMSFDTI